MEELFGQMVLVVANAGVPVLLANLAKNFIPQMDGKTDKIVNVLTIGLFVFAWFYQEWYDPNFLFSVLPGMEFKVKEVIEMINGILIVLVSLGLNKPIYSWVKGKFGLLGKSFSK